MTKKNQIEMDFTPGLTDQFPDLMDLVSVVVYGSRPGLGGVAAALDKSPSLLSRMLNKNPDEQRNLPAEDLPKIVNATGDKRIVYWLIEKFCEDKDSKRNRALDRLAEMLPDIQSTLEQARQGRMCGWL
jgi:hypothetical protein